MKLTYLILFTFLIILCLTNFTQPQNKVYLVLGSDTAIWDGMNTAKYHCYYNLELFTAVSSNTSTVMSESFRNQIEDSYGNKLKMTWWMMAGNIFRYATNNNVPVSNTMTLHLMKKYFGDKIELWNDELSLHYHTFTWTDYDNDGKYWWNQAHDFLETKDDFNFTLAQFLLEENVFPVSFRSGWHYMDNNWQNYLNDLMPYSLHNDYPNKRNDITEPIDNVYDWALSSAEFVPFHPATNNYQLSGDGKGWNVRSEYMGSVTQQLMDQIFQKASQGTDQLACFWSHLPDQNFLNEIQQVNSIVHQVAANYPAVQFQYCTAVEAYKLWLQSNDNINPEILVSEEASGNEVKFLISTNETIFQAQPFVAIKDRYERYIVAECEGISQNTWRTVSSFSTDQLGKVGVAVTDTAGNLDTEFINYLPDDIFIDNGDVQYSEVYGNWTTSTNSAWNLDSRIANLNGGDSAKVRWNLDSDYSGLHNLFVQFPEVSNHVDTVYFEFFKNGLIEDTIMVSVAGDFKKWLYVTTVNLISGENNFIDMSAKNYELILKTLAADVLKQTAYVRDRQMNIKELFIDGGEISIEDSLEFTIEVSNTGISQLTISDLYSTNGQIEILSNLPIQIEGMQKLNLPMIFIPEEIGNVEDTIVIISDDPVNPVYKIPFNAVVENYFRIVDNDDTELYSETGTWYTSVAQAYGPSSRYAYIQSTVNGPTAAFSFILNRNGIYDIYEILPQTVNSANNALYKIIANGVLLDSFYLNQNEGSGSWKNIGRYFLPAEKQILIKVMDTGESTSGPVIRADAFKIALYQETTSADENVLHNTPNTFQLFQNYPNPFNSSTVITWQQPAIGFTSLKIYDVLGNEIATILDKEIAAGNHQINFDASGLSSGMYIYKLQTSNFVENKKMILLK